MPFIASEISITYDGQEISDRVLYRESSFSAQANPISGSFRLVIKDPDQDFTPATGKKVRFSVDGVPLMGGYVMRIGRGNFFPAVDTTNPNTVKTRKWILTGPDFNVLFDKRVIHNPGNPKTALRIPTSHRTLSRALTYLFDHYVDAISGLDYTTYVDDIDVDYGSDSGLYVEQGSYLRLQMDDFQKWGALIYYIDADFKLHFHEYENIRRPWRFTDSNPNGTTTIGFREGEFDEDFSQIVTDALVWGGSALPAPGPEGNVVFARYPSGPVEDQTIFGRLQSAEKEQAAIDRQELYGRWQMAEMNIGADNYLTLGSVKHRAYVIVNGPSGAVPTFGIEGGFNKPIERMNLVWFAHDVPGGDHLRPGEIVDILLYTHDKFTSLPLRGLNVTFPTLPSDNPDAEPLSYVRFEGEFGTSFSDSRHLWKYLKKAQNRARQDRPSIIVTNQTDPEDGVEPGSQAQLFPLEQPDGVLTTFVFPFVFVPDTMQVYLNSLLQIEGTNYSIDEDGGIVFDAPVLEAGDQLYATGIVDGTPGVSGAGMWGGVNGYTLTNVRVGDGLTHGAWSFVARRALPVPSLRAYFQGGPGYGEGDGGTYTFHIRRDDGTGHPDLAGPSYGVSSNVTGFPGASSNTPGKVITFSSTSSLTLDSRYWVVMENVDASPNSNNTSANTMWSNAKPAGFTALPWHWRFQNPLDWQFQYRIGGSWSVGDRYAMICQINYSDGYAQGQSYMEMSYPTVPSEVADINASTNRLVRQEFTTVGAINAVAAGIALQKASGSTGGLTVALRSSGAGRGTLIASFLIPASSFPDGVMDGNNLGTTKAWGAGTFAPAVPLSASTAYRLEYSTTGNSRYMGWPIRSGQRAGYGYSASIDIAFPSGQAQYSTDGGSNWTDFDSSDDDLACFLEWS